MNRIKSEGANGKTAKALTKPKARVRAAGTTTAGKRKAAPETKAPAKKPKQGNRGIVITREEIALRAYFLSEKRRLIGLPGDELGDWVEAEKQLLIEKQRG